MERKLAPGYQYRTYSPNYYAEANGVMLEEFPAMNTVLDRMDNLPPEEQYAWGLFLAGVGQRLMEIGSGQG